MLIDIYTQVGDPLIFIGRLLWQKVVVPRHDAVLVFDPDHHQASFLSQRLWSFEDTAFVPHEVGSQKLRERKSPVYVLTYDELERMEGKVFLLINMAEHAIPELVLRERACRLVEVVGSDTIEAARLRFRCYRTYPSVELRHHVVS